MTKKEIIERLNEQPTLVSLIDEILSAPEAQRPELISAATAFLEQRKRERKEGAEA